MSGAMRKYLKWLVVAFVLVPIAVISAACTIQKPLEGLYKLESYTLCGQKFTAADFEAVKNNGVVTHRIRNFRKFNLVYTAVSWDLSDEDYNTIVDNVNNYIKYYPEDYAYAKDLIITDDDNVTNIRVYIYANYIQNCVESFFATRKNNSSGIVISKDDYVGYSVNNIPFNFNIYGSSFQLDDGNLSYDDRNSNTHELDWNRRTGIISTDTAGYEYGITYSMVFLRIGNVPPQTDI